MLFNVEKYLCQNFKIYSIDLDWFCITRAIKLFCLLTVKIRSINLIKQQIELSRLSLHHCVQSYTHCFRDFLNFVLTPMMFYCKLVFLESPGILVYLVYFRSIPWFSLEKCHQNMFMSPIFEAQKWKSLTNKSVE